MKAVSPIQAGNGQPGANGYPKVARLRSRSASDYLPATRFQAVGS